MKQPYIIITTSDDGENINLQFENVPPEFLELFEHLKLEFVE